METRLYEGTDGEKEFEMSIPVLDYLDWMNRAGVGGFVPVCDLCGVPQHKNFYYYPELGAEFLCEKCAKEHRERVKWYPEDTSAVLNSLIWFVVRYKLNWTEKDYKVIDEYFYYHGHGELHIKKFIEKYGDK